MNNIFENIPEPVGDEVFEIILKERNIQIERIVSTGQKTPEGQWLSQEFDEWVILLKGKAIISFKANQEEIVMKSGDYILIKAYEEHRVEYTSEKEKSIWLAIHFKSTLPE